MNEFYGAVSMLVVSKYAFVDIREVYSPNDKRRYNIEVRS